MAELLSKEMLADLIINIINILILFFVARALLYKPVKKFLDARRAKVAQALKEAEAMKAEAEAAKMSYTALMTDSAAIRSQAMREAREKAEAEARDIVEKANAEAQALLAAGRENAQRERDKLVKDAKDELGVLAVELSGKILQREVTDEDNRRIINAFFGE